jgi:hypothetical protein
MYAKFTIITEDVVFADGHFENRLKKTRLRRTVRISALHTMYMCTKGMEAFYVLTCVLSKS